MRFTLLAAAAACGSLALRPQVSRASSMAKIGALAADIISSPSNSLVALKAATSIVNDIFAEVGNATDHLSNDDTVVLKSVLDLVENTIYSSMDNSHNADEATLATGVAAAASCNTDIMGRQAASGDLGGFQTITQTEQQTLHQLDNAVGEKTETNNTEWTALSNHMTFLTTPPGCPGLPDRSMAPLTQFFEQSAYVMYFNTQQPLYQAKRDAFKIADADLTAAINDYSLHLEVRNTEFCDWKIALEAACNTFDTCFDAASVDYSDNLVPHVTDDMNGRIEVKIAADTLIHQVRFLLAEVDDQATPPIDTTRYQISFPTLPAKGLCDLSPLNSDEWVPVPMCNTPWVLAAGDESCQQSCGRDGRVCDANERTKINSEESMAYAVGQAKGGNHHWRCVSYMAGHAHYGAPYIKYGKCVFLDGDSQVMSECDRQCDGMRCVHQQLCYCKMP